jgi:hypothetical protein
MRFRKSIKKTRKYKGGWFYKSPKKTKSPNSNSRKTKLTRSTSGPRSRGSAGKRITNSRTNGRTKGKKDKIGNK